MPNPTATDMPLLAELLQRNQGVDPAHILLDEHTAAACLGQRPKTLESWRREGKELPFIKLGRTVRYRLSDVLGCIERNTFWSSRAARTRDRRISTRREGKAARKRGPAPKITSATDTRPVASQPADAA